VIWESEIHFDEAEVRGVVLMILGSSVILLAGGGGVNRRILDVLMKRITVDGLTVANR